MPQFLRNCRVRQHIYQTTAVDVARRPVVTGYSYALNSGAVPDDGGYRIVGEAARFAEVDIPERWDGAREVGHSCVGNGPIPATNGAQGFAKFGRGSCYSVEMYAKGYC